MLYQNVVARIQENVLAPIRGYKYHRNVGLVYLKVKLFERPACLYRNEHIELNFNRILTTIPQANKLRNSQPMMWWTPGLSLMAGLKIEFDKDAIIIMKENLMYTRQQESKKNASFCSNVMGGPIFGQNLKSGRFNVIGLKSSYHPLDCSVKQPRASVYQDLSESVDWIKDQIG